MSDWKSCRDFRGWGRQAQRRRHSKCYTGTLTRYAKRNGNFVLVASGSLEANSTKKLIEIVYDHGLGFPTVTIVRYEPQRFKHGPYKSIGENCISQDATEVQDSSQDRGQISCSQGEG
jgi:hypothetical protein